MKNWKTTLSGSLASLGALLTGTGSIDLSFLTPTESHYFKLVGFICIAAGLFFHGLFAQDATPKQ